MKTATPSISDAEWDVMKVVWDHGPLTSGEVVKRLEAEKDWKPRTIKTLLARLVQKGAVEAKETEGKHLYAAKVSREALAKREGRSGLAGAGAFHPGRPAFTAADRRAEKNPRPGDPP